MKQRRILPYIFLGILILALAFLGGIRYGQSIKQTNEVIELLLSITPSPEADITPIDLSLKEYTDEDCDVVLLLPHKEENVKIECTKNLPEDPKAISSQSATLAKDVSATEYILTEKDNLLQFEHPVSDQTIRVYYPGEYSLLIMNSLSFSNER